jgi:hypothetical protein
METGDNRYYAPMERRNISFSQRLQEILGKPFKVLFSEPMLIAVTLYQSVRLVPSCRAPSCADSLVSLVHLRVRPQFSVALFCVNSYNEDVSTYSLLLIRSFSAGDTVCESLDRSSFRCD